MQKYASTGTFYTPLGDAALAASRKVWLAGLGATVVTRNWLESEGGHVFQTLVKQGTVVESRAMRLLGRKVDASLSQANTMWRTSRRIVEASVKQAAASVVDYAQQALPKSLPRIELPKAFAPSAKAPAKRSRKPVKARVARNAKKARRPAKRVTR